MNENLQQIIEIGEQEKENQECSDMSSGIDDFKKFQDLKEEGDQIDFIDEKKNCYTQTKIEEDEVVEETVLKEQQSDESESSTHQEIEEESFSEQQSDDMENLESNNNVEIIEPLIQTEKIGVQEDGYNDILEALKNMSDQLNGLKLLFNKRIAQDKNQEKLIDNMHVELQKYKNDLYASLLKPVLMDIIEVIDSIQKMGKAFELKGEAEKNAVHILTDYIDDLQFVLEKYDVETYSSQPGNAYTPVRQRIIKSIPNENSDSNGVIVESIGYGYMYNEKVLRAEKVIVYKYMA